MEPASTVVHQSLRPEALFMDGPSSESYIQDKIALQIVHNMLYRFSLMCSLASEDIKQKDRIALKPSVTRHLL